jgi:hypothetical protein
MALKRKNISHQSGVYYVPQYEIYRDGLLIGTITKTGTHLDNYPWDWYMAEGMADNGKRGDHAGLLSEAMQDLSDHAVEVSVIEASDALPR